MVISIHNSTIVTAVLMMIMMNIHDIDPDIFIAVFPTCTHAHTHNREYVVACSPFPSQKITLLFLKEIAAVRLFQNDNIHALLENVRLTNSRTIRHAQHQ